jgi:predicted SAM-dependent methyltransferase
MACPTYSGMEYALKAWADAYHAQTYENKGALQVDNSDGPMHGGNLHYTHLIRGRDIPAIWQQTRFPAFWDTLEQSWQIIVEYAHAHDYDFIFSVEADVIVPPDGMQKMVDCALANGNGKPAVVTQRYHPRSQAGGNYWWDTLGCSLFPVDTLYERVDLIKSIYEIQVFIDLERAGYVRYRPGAEGPDLFIPDHLKDPEDQYPSNVGATPAAARYVNRVDHANRKLLVPEEEKPTVPPLTCSPVSLDVESAEPKLWPVSEKAATCAPIPLCDVKTQEEAQRMVLEDDRIRLNVGSDLSQIGGFLSVDFNPKVKPDIVADAKDLSMFPDSVVDEIYASHVLEHFTWQDGLLALKEWLRVLKPGGMLTVATPDITEMRKLYKHGATWGEYNMPIDEIYVQAVAFGANLLADVLPEMKDMYGGPGHRHQSIYFEDMLLNRVLEAGFVYAHEVQKCFVRGSAIGEIMVQARKPKQGE